MCDVCGVSVFNCARVRWAVRVCDVCGVSACVSKLAVLAEMPLHTQIHVKFSFLFLGGLCAGANCRYTTLFDTAAEMRE